MSVNKRGALKLHLEFKKKKKKLKSEQSSWNVQKVLLLTRPF